MGSKIKVFHSSTIPVITYGAQTWSLTRRQYEKLRSRQRRMERAIAGLRWYNHTSNKKLKDITRAKDIGGIVKKLKWNFAGHIAREKGESGVGEYY